MKEIFLLFRHELRAFINSGKSTLFLMVTTVLIWGSVIAGKVETIESVGSFIWVLYFALVVGAGLSTTVFVRERLSSTLETLIMSGVERSSILWGKLIFTTLMTALIGSCAFLLAFFIKTLIFQEPFFNGDELVVSLVLYLSSACLVSSSSAFFSFALTNPRMVQFMNFTLLAVITVAYSIYAEFVNDSLLGLSGIIILLALFFSFFSFRLFKSEKIIQPLIY